MSMSPKEALKILTGAEIMVLNRFHDKFMDAACVALNCLKEKAEQEDPRPLTIEELKQMDGYPFYVVPLCQSRKGWDDWCVLDGNAADIPGIEYFSWDLDAYGETWIAYRHKPKEDAK